MDKKTSLTNIVVPLSLAVAIFSLFVTIFLIFFNQSRFPILVKGKKQQTFEPPEINMVTLAKQDLAKRLNVNITNIEAVSAQEKYWSDTSLGCPQPGMMYAQVITPGYQIILSTQGKTYDYRTNLKEHLVLCL